jgi:hypothetical protein
MSTPALDVRELQYCALISTVIPLSSKQLAGSWPRKSWPDPETGLFVVLVPMSISLAPRKCSGQERQ